MGLTPPKDIAQFFMGNIWPQIQAQRGHWQSRIAIFSLSRGGGWGTTLRSCVHGAHIVFKEW